MNTIYSAYLLAIAAFFFPVFPFLLFLPPRFSSLFLRDLLFFTLRFLPRLVCSSVDCISLLLSVFFRVVLVVFILRATEGLCQQGRED